MKKLLAALVLCLVCGVQGLCAATDYDLEAIKLYNSGLEQYKKGAYAAAIDYFKSAIDIQKDFLDAYYNIALIYDYTGNSAAAISSLETLLDISPEDFSASLKLAQIYYKKSDTSRAVELLERIPNSATEFAEAQRLKERIRLEPQTTAQYEGQSSKAAKAIPLVKNISGIVSPTGIVRDKAGNLFVASFNDNAIFKIMPDGSRMLYSKNPQISGPIGIALDDESNMYVANYKRNNILKIDKYGAVSVFVAHSNQPYFLFVSDNVLYISEQGSNLVVVQKL